MTMGEEALKVYQSSFKSIYLCQVNQKDFPLHGKRPQLIYYFFGIFQVIFSLTPLKSYISMLLDTDCSSKDYQGEVDAIYLCFLTYGNKNF